VIQQYKSGPRNLFYFWIRNAVEWPGHLSKTEPLLLGAARRNANKGGGAR
jgi:hypothetical protein